MALSIGSVFFAGQLWLAIIMSVLFVCCLWLGRNHSLEGATIGWRQGQWLLFDNGSLREVALGRRVCLPWLVRLDLFDPQLAKTHIIILFADSAQPDVLRRLRRRLMFER